MATFDAWNGLTPEQLKERCRQLSRENAQLRENDREAIAAWMMKHSYATGHGDTIEDLLNELVAQVADRHRAPSSW